LSFRQSAATKRCSLFLYQRLGNSLGHVFAVRDHNYRHVPHQFNMRLCSSLDPHAIDTVPIITDVNVWFLLIDIYVDRNARWK